jgi:hypothetical protein
MASRAGALSRVSRAHATSRANPPSPFPRARVRRGNHESANNYTHYKMRFASIAENAGVRSGSFTNMFYSFDSGLAHHVMWDTEAFWSQPLDSQTAMINWLRADLAKA